MTLVSHCIGYNLLHLLRKNPHKKEYSAFCSLGSVHDIVFSRAQMNALNIIAVIFGFKMME